MRDHSPSFIKPIGPMEKGKNFDNYLQRMRGVDSWGGELEVRAITEMLDIGITVVSKSITTHYGRGDGVNIGLNYEDTKNHYSLTLPKNIVSGIDIDLLERGFKKYTDTKNRDELPHMLIKGNIEIFKVRLQSFINQIPRSTDASAAPARDEFFTGYFAGMFLCFTRLFELSDQGVKSIHLKLDSLGHVSVIVVRERNSSMFLFRSGVKNEHSGIIYTYDSISEVHVVNIMKPDKENGIVVSIQEPSDNKIHSEKNGNLEDFLKNKGFLDCGKYSETFYDSTNKFLASFADGLSPQHDSSKNSESFLNEKRRFFEDFINECKTLYKESEKGYIKKSTDGRKKRSRQTETFTEIFDHGFLAGIFSNLRYRKNIKTYIELIAGRGYADLFLLLRGEARSTHSIPIIIELKRQKEKQQSQLSSVYKEALDYVQSLSPNKMRFITSSDHILTVGLMLGAKQGETVRSEFFRMEEPKNFALSLLRDVFNTKKEDIAISKENIQHLVSHVQETFTSIDTSIRYFTTFLFGQLCCIERLATSNDNSKIETYYLQDSDNYINNSNNDDPIPDHVSHTFLCKNSLNGNDKVLIINVYEAEGISADLMSLPTIMVNNKGLSGIESTSEIHELNIITYKRSGKEADGKKTTAYDFYKKSDRRLSYNLYKDVNEYLSAANSGENSYTAINIKSERKKV
ncbi:MAG: hypothetical protein KTV77_04780 [Wolbachia endosymbiont of Fragariocoptes setiger]|nr:hypothetical protein [Wolbachia endosymbiont of Fragariocoptes setiger]